MCKNNNMAPTGSPASDKRWQTATQTATEKWRGGENEDSTEEKQTEQVLTQIDAGKALKTHH